jgi:hypothetical protein
MNENILPRGFRQAGYKCENKSTNLDNFTRMYNFLA